MSNKKRLFLLLASVPFILCSCKDKEKTDALRSEYINVYETSAEKTVDAIQVPFDGVEDGKIHVLSDVDLQYEYKISQSADNPDWLVIKDVKEVEPGHYVVTYDAESLLPLNSLERREGRLSFFCPSASLGKFIPIRQGYQLRFIEEFSDTDEFPDKNLTISGKQTYTTGEYPVLNKDFFDYISFNVWAEVDNEFLSKNITLDITISGGLFYDTGFTTHRVNVPVGTAADRSNLRYLLLIGDGARMSAETKFTFSASNDNGVTIHIDNFAAYVVTESELGIILEDDYFEDDGDDGGDWI